MSFKNCIKNSVIFKKIFEYREISSTNDEAFRLARRVGVPFVVVAERQTEGRGRFNRIWYSPRGENLYFTLVIIHPELKFNELSILTSFVLLKTLQSYCRSLQVKWPNDIVHEGKKVCGILIENEVAGSMVRFSVIGAGINCFTDFSKIGELKDVAVSLKDLTAKKVLRERIFGEFLEKFEKNYMNWRSYRRQVLREWKKNMALMNTKIALRSGGATVTGWLKRVNDDGSIVLSDGSGRRLFTYGEIS